MKLIIFIIIAIFSSVHFASAHGFGQSLEKVVDSYIIDVGIDVLDLVANEPARFDFVLWDKDRNPIDFTDAWVRITPVDMGIMFAGNLHQPEYASAGMSYAFPKAGDYELTVRFQNKDDAIVEASFPIKVSEGVSNTSGSWRQWLSGAFIGFIVGGGLVWFLRRKRT